MQSDTIIKWSGAVWYYHKVVWCSLVHIKWSDTIIKWSGTIIKLSDIIIEWSGTVWYGDTITKWSSTVMKWSGVIIKWSGTVLYKTLFNVYSFQLVLVGNPAKKNFHFVGVGCDRCLHLLLV